MSSTKGAIGKKSGSQGSSPRAAASARRAQARSGVAPPRDRRSKDARPRLLDAALGVMRAQGYAATSIDDLCTAAGVTKGAFFHHFESKEALAVAAADHWSATTGALFANADFRTYKAPLARILGYVAFRKQLIVGDIPEFTCLVGTMAQEVYGASDEIRDACWRSIAGHAQTLEADFAAALREHGVRGDARSLARFTQAALQGGFVLAKAADDPGEALSAVEHLERYLKFLFRKGDAR